MCGRQIHPVHWIYRLKQDISMTGSSLTGVCSYHQLFKIHVLTLAFLWKRFRHLETRTAAAATFIPQVSVMFGHRLSEGPDKELTKSSQSFRPLVISGSLVLLDSSACYFWSPPHAPQRLVLFSAANTEGSGPVKVTGSRCQPEGEKLLNWGLRRSQ